MFIIAIRHIKFTGDTASTRLRSTGTELSLLIEAVDG